MADDDDPKIIVTDRRLVSSVVLPPGHVPRGAYKIAPDGSIEHAKREVEASTIGGLRRQVLPCCLCGEPIMHGAVDGPEVELIFRAQTDSGITWVPLKGHAGPNCPDPEPLTAAFWRNKAKRERYKARRRKRAEEVRRRRGE